MKIKESQLRDIIKESVKHILKEAEDYGWVVENDEAREAYEMACEYMGKEYVDEAIIESLGTEQLAECLAFIFRMNDFREWYDKKASEEEEY